MIKGECKGLRESKVIKEGKKRRVNRRKWMRLTCSFFLFCVAIFEKKEQARCE